MGKLRGGGEAGKKGTDVLRLKYKKVHIREEAWKRTATSPRIKQTQRASSDTFVFAGTDCDGLSVNCIKLMISVLYEFL